MIELHVVPQILPVIMQNRYLHWSHFVGEEIDSEGSRSRKANRVIWLQSLHFFHLVIFSPFEQKFIPSLAQIQGTIRFLLPYQWPRKGMNIYCI